MPETNTNKQTSRSNSTKIVWVGCKLSNGITLELFEDAPAVPGVPGVVTPLMFKPPATKAKITLKGANSVKNDWTARGLAQPQYPFGVTAVPADFWTAWLAAADNRNLPFIKNGFVFALDRERDLLTEARQRESERTGAEPLDPVCENDPRMPAQKNLPPEKRVVADQERLRTLNAMNGK